MSRQGLNLFHRWVLPKDDLVQTVTMGRDELVVLRKHQIANLRARVEVIHSGESLSVPKADAAVSSASARRKKPSLVLVPSYGLHGCLVF